MNQTRVSALGCWGVSEALHGIGVYALIHSIPYLVDESSIRVRSDHEPIKAPFLVVDDEPKKGEEHRRY